MKIILTALIVFLFSSCSENRPELNKASLSENAGKNEDGTSSVSSLDKSGTAARVGGEKLLAAIDTCNGEGRFYDRKLVVSLDEETATEGQFEAGCTSLKLSSIECSKDALLTHTKENGSEELATTIESNISALALEEFQIDQCAECESGNTLETCKLGEGDDAKAPSLDIIVIAFVDKIGNVRKTSTVK
jgi:hypothetical protein